MGSGSGYILEEQGVLSDGPGGLSDGPGGLSDGPGGLSDGPGGLSDGPGGLSDGSGVLSDGPGMFFATDRAFDSDANIALCAGRCKRCQHRALCRPFCATRATPLFTLRGRV